VNTDSVTPPEMGSSETPETQARPRATSRTKSASVPASGENLFKNNPDAISDRMRPLHDITVDHNVEKAMRVLKRKLIREGLFKELKLRRFYEKPSEKKKRKSKESVKRTRKEEARAKKFLNGLV